MITPKIFIGPMSLNVVDSIIEYCNENNVSIGVIPSRRQVEFDGGYVNKWTTSEFCKYIKSKTDKILIVRDHGGPAQGDIYDDGFDSFNIDCVEGNMDVLHIDVWKSTQDFETGIAETIKYINYCYELNPNIIFEVGTEQTIRPITVEELDKLLTMLKSNLRPEVYKNIHYVVIQSGTALQGNKNTGQYNKDQLINMISIIKKHKMTSKEHNGDYISESLIKEKFDLGLDSINIAPEFGQIETRVILEKMKDIYPELIELFFDICYKSKKWTKWVADDFDPKNNKEEIINICGHYVFSNIEFIKLKQKLKVSDEEIKIKIKNKIKNLLSL